LGRNSGEKAVIPLNLFKHGSFNGSIIGLFIAGTVLNGAMLLLPLLFQNVRHMSVLMASLALIPQGLGMLISRPLTGRLTDSIGAKYVVIVSAFIAFVGTIPFYWTTQRTSYWIIAVVLLVRGIGAGGILMPLMADSYTGMKNDQIPSATIGSRILQNIGSAFGSALVTTVVTAFSASHVKSFRHQLKMGSIKPTSDQLATFIHQHLVTIRLEAFQQGFLMISLAVLLIILPALLLSNKIKSKG
jgi:MFS family permease